MKERASYINIFKATSLFGGVQLFQIIINLLRGKAIALLLGSSGMGLNSLFVSSTSIVNNISGLGLNFSSVREISKAVESKDENEIINTVSVFKKLLYLTALIGLIIMIIASPLISSLSFGSNKYILSFTLLSLLVFFNTLSTGNSSILRGIRDLKRYALFSLTGSITSLLVSLPLYYFFGLKAIVPALIISAILTFLFSRYYLTSAKVKSKTISFRNAIFDGKKMIRLGTSMMMTTFLNSLAHYLINIFISNYGTIDDLGFYFAAMNITTQSVGLVFSVIIIDYQPRLAAVSDDIIKTNTMVNQQSEISVLISTPILITLIVFSPLLISILLSSEFNIIVPLVRMMSFALIFKTLSYAIGAVSYAKGDSKIFFALEGVFNNILMLTSIVVGYWIFGLNGIGYAFVTIHVLYLVTIIAVNRKLYSYKVDSRLMKVFSANVLLVLLSLLCFFIDDNLIAYTLSTILLAGSILLSYKHLDSLIGIGAIINRFRLKVINKN